MDTRQHDLNQLRESWKTASPTEKKYIEQTAHKISNESGRIKNMREELVKAHRNGDRAEIRDIHEYIARKREYRNE